MGRARSRINVPTRNSNPWPKARAAAEANGGPSNPMACSCWFQPKVSWPLNQDMARMAPSPNTKGNRKGVRSLIVNWQLKCNTRMKHCHPYKHTAMQ